MGAQKDATQQYTFRIPVELKAAVELIAKDEERSLSKQIIIVLRKFVNEKTKGEVSQVVEESAPERSEPT